VVKYVTNRDQITELFQRVLEIIIPTRRFFNFGGNMVYVRRGKGLLVLDRFTCNGILSNFLEIKNVTRTNNNQDKIQNYQLLSHNHLLVFINSPEILEALPKLEETATNIPARLSWSPFMRIVSTPPYYRENPDMLFYHSYILYTLMTSFHVKHFFPYLVNALSVKATCEDLYPSTPYYGRKSRC
jgi:hypothetical protein